MLRTRKEICKYLDDAIAYWRQVNEDEKHESHEYAVFYLDAFISVKNSIFGRDEE